MGTGLPKDWLDAKKMASQVAQSDGSGDKKNNVGNVANNLAKQML